jgi:hypothetical protein
MLIKLDEPYNNSSVKMAAKVVKSVVLLSFFYDLIV